MPSGRAKARGTRPKSARAPIFVSAPAPSGGWSRFRWSRFRWSRFRWSRPRCRGALDARQHGSKCCCVAATTPGDVASIMEGDAFDPFVAAARHGRLVFGRRCDRDGTCAVCLDNLRGRRISAYPCGHALHTACHLRLRASRCTSKGCCPTCRRPCRDPSAPEEEDEEEDEDEARRVDDIDDILDVLVTLGMLRASDVALLRARTGASAESADSPET